MLLAIFLAASLLPSQQASMGCVDGGSEIATRQTEPLRGPGGVVAVLKVSSADDHGKDTHLCNAEYVLLLTPHAGVVRAIDLLTTDGDWGRTLSLRLEGFTHSGKRLFGVVTEHGEYPSTVLFDYDADDDKVQLIDLKKQFARLVTARCSPIFGVVGTTDGGAIVVELSSAKPCAPKGRWVLNPTDGSVQRLPQGASMQSLYTPGADGDVPTAIRVQCD